MFPIGVLELPQTYAFLASLFASPQSVPPLRNFGSGLAWESLTLQLRFGVAGCVILPIARVVVIYGTSFYLVQDYS